MTDGAYDFIDSTVTNRAILVSKIVGICIALVALVWIVFGQTLRHQFVNIDDGAYVFRNPNVTQGVNIQGTKWAFTHAVAANWHPLTMLSHMLDCQFFGVTPAGHHFTNVVLHAVASVLLFLAVWWMTGRIWRSAFVASVFAVHPLHVESVAWIAERKDVLSAVFFMLTLAAYVYYSRRPSLLRYALVFVLLACGLMAKPMLVTLPFVLLLLDYWPLTRFQTSKVSGQASVNLIAEKIPLLILSGVASVAALATQHQSINLVKTMSLAARIGNAFASLGLYLVQSVWPANLAVFYPFPQTGIVWWEVTAGIALFLAISVAAWVCRRNRPYLLTGWLWYVGMLLPVLGVVQVGIQSHADRYMYLPQIGLCLMIAWLAADVFSPWRYRTAGAIAASAVLVASLTWAAWVQTSYWQDSESLWTRDVAVTADNEMAREHLSDAYLDKGRIDDAIVEARAAVSAESESADAHGVLGAALARRGPSDEAIAQLETALRLNPRLARAHYNLGNVFVQKGDIETGIDHYEQELRIQPQFAEGHNNLANALFKKGQIDQGLAHLKIALELNRNYPEAHNNLGIALSQTGRMPEAIAEWEKVLELQPDNLEANCNLAWILATYPDASVRNGARAVECAKRAIQLSDGKNARIWRLAAAAYAEAGRFPDAVKAAQNGIGIAEAEGNSTLIQTLQANLKVFEQGLPLRD